MTLAACFFILKTSFHGKKGYVSRIEPKTKKKTMSFKNAKAIP